MLSWSPQCMAGAAGRCSSIGKAQKAAVSCAALFSSLLSKSISPSAIIQLLLCLLFITLYKIRSIFSTALLPSVF